ncbi:MAG: SH3 domain-containing protein, partial [Candidatus Binatia bacterium]
MPMRMPLLKLFVALALVALAAHGATAQGYDEPAEDWEGAADSPGRHEDHDHRHDEPEASSGRDRYDEPERPAAEAGGRPGTYITNREANLYSRPSADSRILHRIPLRTIVEVVDVSEQWYEVRSRKGKPSGFIRRSYAE